MPRDALHVVSRHFLRRFRGTSRPATVAMAVVFSSAAAASCVRAPQMCIADSECRALSSCVAGRCVSHGAVPAIATARRILYVPVDVAYLRRGDTADEGVTIAALGCSDGGLLLMRFAIELPPETAVLEAYVLLERATEVDDDPTALALHAARAVEPWDSGSVSWARQPRLDDWGSPVTRVRPGSGPILRLDVRAIVQRWRRRGSDEFGLAIVVDGKSATGISVALAPSFDSVRPASRFDPALSDLGGDPSRAIEGPSAAPERFRSDPSLGRGIAFAGPQLELYVK